VIDEAAAFIRTRTPLVAADDRFDRILRIVGDVQEGEL
jgi:hypothetical protein